MSDKIDYARAWHALQDMVQDWLVVGHGEEVTVLNRVLDMMDNLEREGKKERTNNNTT